MMISGSVVERNRDLGIQIGGATVVIDDKGSGVGLWAGGGFVYRWGDHLNLGLDVRYSDASVSLRPRSTPEVLDLDSGGVQYGVVVGYHW